MELLSAFHSWFRWVVLVALLGGGLLGIAGGVRRDPWTAGSHRPFTLAAVIMDVQVATGVVLWLAQRAWETAGFFIGVLHPAAMLGAVGIAHLAVGRARRSEGRSAHLTAGAGLLVALAVVVSAIPRWAWF